MEFLDPGESAPTGSAHGLPPAHVPGPEPASVEDARPRTIWGWALAAGILAGTVSWLGGESIHGAFDVPAESEYGVARPAEVVARVARLRMAGQMKDGALTFGMLGGALGLTLGMAGGMARRNGRAALLASGAGLIFGAGAGAGTAWALVRVYYQNQDPNSTSLLLPLLVHGGIWSSIGLAGGVALGIGLGGRDRALRTALGGLLGAIVGTLVYEIAGALAFPSAKAHHPVSQEVGSRLLAHLVVAFFVAAGAAIAAQDPKASSVRR